jgi:hypothetical protein
LSTSALALLLLLALVFVFLLDWAQELVSKRIRSKKFKTVLKELILGIFMILKFNNVINICFYKDGVSVKARLMSYAPDCVKFQEGIKTMAQEYQL